MGKIVTEKIEFENYGKCLKVSNGIIEIIVTVDIGPRVLRLGFCGGENFFFEDIDRKVVNSDPSIEAVFGKGSKWYIYGGHRMWLSPEDMPLSYYPDCEPVSCREIPCGVELIPPAQRINDVQYRFVITMDENKPEVKVEHFVTNVGPNTIHKAIWCLSVLNKGGLEVVPRPVNDTGLLSNCVMSLWPYTDMSDPRVFWGKKYITLRQDKDASAAFKFGINLNREWVAYLHHGDMFVKSFHINSHGNYPDSGVSFETYTNQHFMEMESLGELIDITPGSTASHTEKWTLVKDVARPAQNDEAAVDALVKKHIEK